MTPITGSCLCNKVTYTLKNGIEEIVHCHCQTCRKAHAAAFSSVAKIMDEDFEINSGIELLKSYESSPGKQRYFCSNCGSQIYAKKAGTPHLVLRMGTVDTNQTIPERCHIWLSDKASWYQLNSDIAGHDEFEA